MRLPRMISGWVRAFWLTVRHCPQCHNSLCRDWPMYDTGGLWCLPCGGINLPDGFFEALRWNRKAV